jgi:hypothetical protein
VSDVTCSVEDCERTGRLKRGWCNKHYARWLRHGDPTLLLVGKGSPCSVDECPRPFYGQGFCKLHYQRWKRNGDPLSLVRRERGLTPICLVGGCGRPHHAQGWCGLHHKRWWKTGTTDAPPEFERGHCKIEGCLNLARAYEMCPKHFRRWLRYGDPFFTAVIMGDDEARFWSKVDKGGPVPTHRPDLGACWIWIASCNHNGYGAFAVTDMPGRTGIVAHKWAWEQENGPADPRLHLDHLCRRPECVNPSHLDPVPPRENWLRGAAAVLVREAEAGTLSDTVLSILDEMKHSPV